jgi:Flp pilus assembly protein TadG
MVLDQSNEWFLPDDWSRPNLCSMPRYLRLWGKGERVVRINHRKTDQRAGVAAVEFAVCLPVILILVIGTIQACSMLFLKQSLSVVAYEGVRTCVDYKSTPADLQSVCEQILKDRNVKGASVTVSPSDFDKSPIESWITVTVTAPCDTNAAVAGFWYSGRSLTSNATMMKEF